MEQKLKKLFEYQRFESNEKLEKLIRETEYRYASEIADDDLFEVSAAGEPEGDPIPGGSAAPEKSQIGGLVGYNEGGSVSGRNIGGLTGDFIGNYAEPNGPKE